MRAEPVAPTRCHGPQVMDLIVNAFVRTWTDITSGRHAPLSFRFVVQPLMAAFLAFRAGRQDARDGRPLYFWALATDSAQRRALLKEGWQHVGKVFVLAIVIDAIYQFIVQRWVYPVETIMVAAILAVIPYLVVRSLINHVLRWKIRK